MKKFSLVLVVMFLVGCSTGVDEKSVEVGDNGENYCQGSEMSEIGSEIYPVDPRFGDEGDRLGQMLTAIDCGEDRLVETGFDQSYENGLRVVLTEGGNNTAIMEFEELGFVCEENSCEKSEAFMPIELEALIDSEALRVVDFSDCINCG
jgi:hypothetical protein